MKKELCLRDYQNECIDIIDSMEAGSGLVVLATGMGKTVIFSHLKRKGRVLLLSHREELVHQPEKYYDCSFGVERAKEVSHGEDVVSASVQSLVRRLPRFSPTDFDMIITDEAHHAVAASYRKIYDYFKPRLHIGFTATPNRGDKVRLDAVYDSILFERNIEWGISKKYLCDIDCKRVTVSYDLSKVKKTKQFDGVKDYKIDELSQAMNQDIINEEIAQVYQKYAKGQTLIFATSVDHAYNIAEKIPGAVVVDAKTKDRDCIIEDFTERKFSCLINCMIFTEGTDIPLIETIIIARPTQNTSLYTQMVGRGLRQCEGKENLTLIDCVGVTEDLDLCTASSLLGLDLRELTKKQKKKLQCKFSELRSTVQSLSNTPAGWLLGAKKIELFGREQCVDFRGVWWKQLYDDTLTCSLPDVTLQIPPVDEVGRTQLKIFKEKKRFSATHCNESTYSLQVALDCAFHYLEKYCDEEKPLWCTSIVHRWGQKPCTTNQLKFIQALATKDEFEELVPEEISSELAGLLIENLKARKGKKRKL